MKYIIEMQDNWHRPSALNCPKKCQFFNAVDEHGTDICEPGNCPFEAMKKAVYCGYIDSQGAHTFNTPNNKATEIYYEGDK